MTLDLERRFGGLRRLYGASDYEKIRAAHLLIVGLGGVGSWVAEALARSGVAALTLIDMDHVTESNINRQVQASGKTVGQAKGVALRERITDIHPGCEVRLIDDFVTPANWPHLLSDSPATFQPLQGAVDACDQVSAKTVLAAWARAIEMPLITVGAAGGKQRPDAVEVADLAEVTHDPLLASMRQRLRKSHAAAKVGALQVQCVFSREAVCLPISAVGSGQASTLQADLNCHGYGSSVMVTATFGFVAAAQVLQKILR
jgi:tRNA threonylcarbamoyladenosine dehydratase